MAQVVARNDYLVVMTATIDPATGPAKIARRDPKQRLADYLAALRFWMNLNDRRIRQVLFLENSGYPLDELQRAVDQEKPADMDVELVSMRTNDYPPEMHYGYSELLMLDTGLAMSRLAKQTRYWMKVTGRLTFPNVGRLLDRLPNDYLFAADLRNAIPIFGPKQLWVHTRMLITTGAFYDRALRGICHQLPPGNAPIEMMLYHTLARFQHEPGAILRFPVHVPPHGRSAFEDFSYQNSKRSAVDAARHVARVFLPDWWI
jgi:hypothetical protein